MMMMVLMVSPCKVILVVDILDDEVGVHSSLLLLPDYLVATSFENGFLLFFYIIAFFKIKGMHSLCLTLYYSSVVLSRPCCDWTWMGLLFADMTKL